MDERKKEKKGLDTFCHLSWPGTISDLILRPFPNISKLLSFVLSPFCETAAPYFF